MKIEDIYIKNFRAIEEETFSFNESFNILIGDNAKGKTTILDALAFALGTFMKGVDGIKSEAIRQADKRIKVVKPGSIEPQLPLEIRLHHTYSKESYSWKRATNTFTGASTTYREASNLINRIKNDIDRIRKGENVELPLIAYYGIGRLVTELKERKKRKSGSRIEGYRDALDPRTKQTVALSWMKEMQEAVFQEYQAEEKSIDQDLFKAFTNSLESMIPGWTKIQYNLKYDDIFGYFEDKGWQRLTYLSSGYKAMVKLAMDIAYRAIILNPQLGINAVKEIKGVVLIDELDMHLHPKWQRVVVENLKQTFPKIQFIASTHSPFIVQSISANEIINLDKKPLAEDPNKLGLEENSLYMGVESTNSKEFDDTEGYAYNFLELLDSKNKSESVKKQLDDLIDRTPDPVFKAKLRLEKMKKFGE